MSLTPPSLAVLEGIRHLQASRLKEAEACFRAALAKTPRDAVAFNCLGIVSRGRGETAAAEHFFSQAVANRPEFAEAISNWGNALFDRGEMAAAAEKYAAAIRLKPDFAEAHNGLGAALLALRQPTAAEASLREALRRNPGLADAHNNLGNLLRIEGRPLEAIASFQSAVGLNPTAPAILNNAAIALRDVGRIGEAVGCCEQALRLRPDFAEAWNTLGGCQLLQNDAPAAAESYRRAVECGPQSVEFLTNWQNVLRQLDRVEDARRVGERLIAREPNEPRHRLRQSSLWPAAFVDRSAMVRHRDDALEAWRSFADTGIAFGLADVAEQLAEPPFNLQFMEANARPWKEAYAAVFAPAICRAGAAERLTGVPSAPRANTGPGRVGVVVTRGHEGIFLKSMQGVLRRLSSPRFETTVFCPLATEERVRRELDAPQVLCRPLPARFDLAARTLRDARCDVLYYWEIGTDATNYFLPFLRLAPIQCTSWGVQVTSGIPNVDYYLSSRLVEPPDAAAHYSEKLLLAETLLTFQSPAPPLADAPGREFFGFSPAANLYVCAQQSGKFHGDFDPLLAGVLRGDRRAIIAVTADRCGRSAEILRERWRLGMPDVADRIVFQPRLEARQYAGLVMAADVLLDPPHFGGVNSTYDGLAAGKPIVTLPGQFHRSRYTLGCFRRLEVGDTVAATPEEYVKIAVRLGTDAAWRREVEEKLLAARPRLFEDPDAVREHERLFSSLVDEARTRSESRST